MEAAVGYPTLFKQQPYLPSAYMQSIPKCNTCKMHILSFVKQAS